MQNEESQTPELFFFVLKYGNTHMHMNGGMHNTHTHAQTRALPFALWARQQLCLVQVEEQLMNQTERLTIHIC